MKVKARVTIEYVYDVDIPDAVAELAVEEVDLYVRRVAQRRHESNCKYSDETWDTVSVAMFAVPEIH